MLRAIIVKRQVWQTGGDACYNCGPRPDSHPPITTHTLI
jgi:hypothetical protein